GGPCCAGRGDGDDREAGRAEVARHPHRRGVLGQEGGAAEKAGLNFGREGPPGSAAAASESPAQASPAGRGIVVALAATEGRTAAARSAFAQASRLKCRSPTPAAPVRPGAAGGCS